MCRSVQVKQVVVAGAVSLGWWGFATMGFPGLPVPAAVAHDPNPEPDSRQVSPNTSISGVFTGEQVHPNFMRLLVNGRDVTSQSAMAVPYRSVTRRS